MKKNIFDKEGLLVEESLFSVANGYIGIRGNFEEGYSEAYETIRGSYINGVYDIVDLKYAENAYGFPGTAQKMLNIMDAQGIYLYFDNEKFNLFDGNVVTFERGLNLESGYALRHMVWISNKGHEVAITIKRMASFVDVELFFMTYEIVAKNFSGNLRIESTLEGNVENYSGKGEVHDPRVNAGHTKFLEILSSNCLDLEVENHDKIKEKTSSSQKIGQQVLRTRRSGIEIVATMGHTVEMEYKKGETSLFASYNGLIQEDVPFRFAKIVAYSDSRRTDNPMELSYKLLEKAMNKGVQYYFKEQESYLKRFWELSGIKISGNDGAEDAVRYNTYQLLSSAGRDGISNVSAKGLSGEGYEGHYFWDTEIYILPFFSLTQPKLAKQLLRYRYHILDNARKRAKELGHKKGAKIPWRTINGDECSGYFPAGCAQYHINADVAYAFIQYFLITDDLQLILDIGFEVLLETARIWMDMGHYISNSFRIDAVTGPDEYTAIVNNNYYTNSMAKYHLEYVCFFYDLLKEKESEQFNSVIKRLHVDTTEINEMKSASAHMYLPFDESLNICLQDDSFQNKAEWDFTDEQFNKRPLLLYYHPLTIYRYKVLKQADTVLALFLLDNEKNEVIRDTYDYYESRTTHDSSLSPCVHGIMSARIGDMDSSYRFFLKTMRLDLDNLHHNTKDGLHIANLGGAYLAVVYGFAGLRIKRDGVHLWPQLPVEWDDYSFSIMYHQIKVDITITRGSVHIKAEEGMTIFLYEEKITINKENHLFLMK